MKVEVEVEFDEEGYKRSVARYFEETLRPALAQCVDTLAANAVKRLEVAAQTAFREATPLTTRAFARTKADAGEDEPSALVYVRDDALDVYELAVFGGVAHDVIVPARDADVDSYGKFRPGYLKQVEDSPSSVWIVGGARNDRFLIERGADGRTRFIAIVLPEVMREPTFDFFGTVEKSLVQDLVVDAGLDLNT